MRDIRRNFYSFKGFMGAISFRKTCTVKCVIWQVLRFDWIKSLFNFENLRFRPTMSPKDI